jgi:signal recognition particle receptor subunit beta
MSFLNTLTRELFLKIVYAGPGMCGKTANVQHIHTSADPSRVGKMISLNTESERTLFFDFMPVTLGEIRGYTTRLQIYTVPGQIFYHASRRLILRGIDGLVFVADSQEQRSEANAESLEDIQGILAQQDTPMRELPHVFQLNKRDLPGISSVEELRRQLAPGDAPVIEAVASRGVGVHETLKAISRLVLARQTVRRVASG